MTDQKMSYKEVAADLRKKIDDGTYPPDTNLPKLTELQRLYHVSTTTVRSAIAELQAQGLVEAVRRRGTVVRKRPGRHRVITRSRAI